MCRSAGVLGALWLQETRKWRYRHRQVLTLRTQAHRRHEARHGDPRASPRASTGTRPSTPIVPAGPTKTAALISTEVPSFTVSAADVHASHSVSMCDEAKSELLHSAHRRMRTEAGVMRGCNGTCCFKPSAS